MREGDIFIVEETPSAGNDVAHGDYPVYGIILEVEDEEYDVPCILTEVHGRDGRMIEDHWYFCPNEFRILEEA